MKKIRPDCNLAIVMGKSVERFKMKLKEEINGGRKKKAEEETTEERI